MKRAIIPASIALLVLTCLSAVAAQAPAAKKAAAKHPVVLFETTMGDMKIEVLTDKAPITAKNFLDYVNSGFYTGTVFHRVDFAICGGGYLQNLSAKTPGPPIKNESKNGLKNLKYTLSMTRYDDPHSATSQFFINVKDNPHLDPEPGGWGYAVFAKVIEGMDVVDKIGAVKTANRTPFYNVPLQPIMIKSARVLP
jgi:cyclophilin family peptidyl-prolyl cis-trans isomerase